MRGMATLPQGIIPQGATSGQRQSWKTPGELGLSKSMECDIFPSVIDTVRWVTGRTSGL